MSDNSDLDDSIEPPTTLAEMQSLTTEDFRKIDRYDYRGSVSKRKVIRHLILLASDELSWQGKQNANSLRDFWYNPTKAVVEAAFPDAYGGPGASTFSRNMSKCLSSVLSDLVKEGQLTYRSLNIVDDSREREVNDWSIESDKVLFVEKDSAYRKLKPLQSVYNLSLVSGSGWQATALIEDLVHELDTDQEYTFYVLGDYDPAGFGIVEDFVERAAVMGLNVDRERSRRIGVTPDQVDDDIVDDQKFTVGGSGDRVDEWKAQYGIDGEYGLELEAVGASLEGKARALRQLVVDEIGDDIREQKRRATDTANAVSSATDGAARSVASQITDDLETALREAAADIIANRPWVYEASASRFGAKCSIDFDAVDEGDPDDDFMPTPYDTGKLHDGAVKGRSPNVKDGATKRAVKAELNDRIQRGDIDVQDLLNL